MNKLSHLAGDIWEEFSFPPVFAYSDPSSGFHRIESAAPSGDASVFERMVLKMEPPYFLLYVLHTPRGEARPGRYQSPVIEAVELRAFIERFSAFLGADARFDIWTHSPSENATVVWDRHNLLYGYGPVGVFASELRALGFVEGDFKVPVPHQHHYRKECDEDAQELLRFFQWSYSPLRPEDVQ